MNGRKLTNGIIKQITKLIALILIITNLASLTAFAGSPGENAASAPDAQPTGLIYLYGEAHGVETIMDKEFELWYEYYHNEGMRHLFLEYSYFTAEFLNIWMQSDTDDILNAVYRDWRGTATYVPYIKDFFKKIKSECPETIFHGTDVGHQYQSTGARFIKYLENNDLEDSEQYLLAQEVIEQGRYYYDNNNDPVYRENKMTENFIREFDKLENESIMGIYGGAHTGLDEMDFTGAVPCMANQLKERYGDIVKSGDLTQIPHRTDTINVAGKDYVASYYGEMDMTGFKDYAHREFWRLEDAYEDFKDYPKTGDVLPYNNYRMKVEEGQVFVIDYTKTDGSVTRSYYRSDGSVWNDMPSTEEFILK